MSLFEFDPVKDALNRQIHGLPLAVGIVLFAGSFIEEEDVRVNYGETRFVATGPIHLLGDRICVVVYTWRNGIRRLISVRKANDREVAKYRSHHP